MKSYQNKELIILKTFVKEKVDTIVKYLESIMVIDKQPVEDMAIVKCGYKGADRPPMPDGSWDVIRYGQEMEGVDDHYWLYKKIRTPKQTAPDQRQLPLRRYPQ